MSKSNPKAKNRKLNRRKKRRAKAAFLENWLIGKMAERINHDCYIMYGIKDET